MLNNAHIAFWTTGYNGGYFPADIGCAAHGFADQDTWADPEESSVGIWHQDLKGTVVTGTRKSVLSSISLLDFEPRAMVIFFKVSEKIDSFLKQLHQIHPEVPVIGGAAALTEGQDTGYILPAEEEVVIFAAAKGDFELKTLNIYDESIIELEIKKSADREFDSIRILPDGNWQNAADFYDQQRTIYGIEKYDFESLTFHDLMRRNIHCSISGRKMISGANLPENKRLKLCTVNKKDATRRVSDFISVERSLIIGCAGIRSLILEPLKTGKNSLAGFLFGEVVTIDHQPIFGNLMLGRLTLI